MTWGYKEKATAERLKSLLTPGMAQADLPKDAIASRGLIFLTPSGGIPARVGTTCGKATCTLYYIDEDDDLVPFENESSGVTLEVWNIAEESVAGDTFIQTKDCLGKPVADWEPC